MKQLEEFILCVIGVLPIIIMVGVLYLGQNEKKYIREKYRKIIKSTRRSETKKMFIVFLLMIIASCIILYL